MKVDLDQVLVGLNGESMKISVDGSEPVEMALRLVFCQSLSFSRSVKPTLKDKMYRANIASRLYLGEEADISENTLSLLRKVVAEVFPPIVVKRVVDIIGEGSDD